MAEDDAADAGAETSNEGVINALTSHGRIVHDVGAHVYSTKL
jgi:hypothetical protein